MCCYICIYGSYSELILVDVISIESLGEYFGYGLYEVELCYLVEKEWVVEFDDVIWCCIKLGMILDDV